MTHRLTSRIFISRSRSCCACRLAVGRSFQEKHPPLGPRIPFLGATPVLADLFRLPTSKLKKPAHSGVRVQRRERKTELAGLSQGCCAMRCMDLPDAALQNHRFVFLCAGLRSLAKPNLPNVLLFPVRVSTLLVLIWTLPEHLSLPLLHGNSISPSVTSLYSALRMLCSALSQQYR